MKIYNWVTLRSLPDLKSYPSQVHHVWLKVGSQGTDHLGSILPLPLMRPLHWEVILSLNVSASWSKHRNNKSTYFMGSLQKLSNLKLVKHLIKVALVSAHYMIAMIIIMKHRSLKDFQSSGPLTGLHLYFLSVDKAASQQTPLGGLYTYHTFCLMSPQLLFIFSLNAWWILGV